MALLLCFVDISRPFILTYIITRVYGGGMILWFIQAYIVVWLTLFVGVILYALFFENR